MIIQVGICDDNLKDLEWMERETHTAFANLQAEYAVSTFHTGNALMSNFDAVLGYDLLLLDIDMPGVDGIQVAERIMEQSHRVNIIFVTNREDLVFEAIRYSPFRFIRKEHLHEELMEAITAAMDKIYKETLLYKFGSGSDTVKIPICDILYLESQKHYLSVHTIQGEQKIIRGKISDYTEQLADVGFLRVHVGFLVNVRFISAITSQKVVLDNGEELPISRAKIDTIKQMHASYVRRFVRGIH